MMNHSNKMLEFIRKPMNIIISILVVGLLVNAIIFTTMTVSHLDEHRKVTLSYEKKERELSELIATPLPITADEEEIKNLEIQIPETNEFSEIYEQVRNIAIENGLIVLSFTSNHDLTTDEESIESFIADNDGPSGEANTATAPQNNKKTPESSDKENKFYQEIVFNLGLIGKIDQLFSFTDQLNKANRLLNVKSWRFIETNIHDNRVQKLLNLTMEDQPDQSYYTYDTEVVAYVWKQSIVKGQPMYERDSTPSYEDFMKKFPELADELNVQLQSKNLEDGQ
jgi:Tfp pilus assembly protein PilO